MREEALEVLDELQKIELEIDGKMGLTRSSTPHPLERLKNGSPELVSLVPKAMELGIL